MSSKENTLSFYIVLKLSLNLSQAFSSIKGFNFLKIVLHNSFSSSVYYMKGIGSFIL